MLIDWAGAQIVRDAEVMVEKGLVLEADFDDSCIKGSVLWNNRPLKTGLRILQDGTVENLCPCYANKERGIICPHAIAVAETMVRRNTDPDRNNRVLAEMRRARRLAAIDDSLYIKRVPSGAAGSMPARLELKLDGNWIDGFMKNAVPVNCELYYRGKGLGLDDVPRNLAVSLNKKDEALLYVLEDISEGPARSRLTLNRTDFINILELLQGKGAMLPDSGRLSINSTPLATHFRMAMNEGNGEICVWAHTETPFCGDKESPVYLIAGKKGWIYSSAHVWPLDNLLPAPYHGIYAAPITIPRESVYRFLKRELPLLRNYARIESDLSVDLFTFEPAKPGFELAVQGSPASVSAQLKAVYGGISVFAAKPDASGDFGIPDPEDVMAYRIRNTAAEKEALAIASQAGFNGCFGDRLESIVGHREVLNFLAGSIPRLRRRGWKIAMEGRVSQLMEDAHFATPVVHINSAPDSNWFDVAFDFEDQTGSSISQQEIQQALLKGDSYINKGRSTVFIDDEAVSSLREIFTDCASRDSDQSGHFSLPSTQAAFVKASLDALDGIDIEDTKEWRMRAARHNRKLKIEPVTLDPTLSRILRPYQKEGVNWLHFLQKSGFSGILADEMGLGKTPQTLAWLQLITAHPDNGNKPALIVCPSSIVDNWAEEAEKFTPQINVCAMTGPDRSSQLRNIKTFNLALTSYALLRRDIEEYLKYHFSVVVLDEAQHIKNRSTQNAKSAKMLKADHRLVLTGTPVENSVSDLWSIMDFLMPGYLGNHDKFHLSYELPIARGGPDAAMAQLKLKRKLRPFMLRRLKKDVARDLPPKIQRVSMCHLTRDQQQVYKTLLAQYKKKITDMVSLRGFNKSRMEILTLLMRLRQTCCHLDLLKLPGLEPREPSAKTELFLELLNEAVDSGHRALVFSQFVSMLQILRTMLEAEGHEYCYLDGSTKDRMKVVHKFNTQRNIPVFLISLKAGGTGLNLTGADMVIHFDPWWNPAVEAQATDRAYRIGQKRTVYSIKLITRGTVEEKVLELQKKKKAVIDATVESDDHIRNSLSWEDIQELIDT